MEKLKFLKELYLSFSIPATGTGRENRMIKEGSQEKLCMEFTRNML